MTVRRSEIVLLHGDADGPLFRADVWMPWLFEKIVGPNGVVIYDPQITWNDFARRRTVATPRFTRSDGRVDSASRYVAVLMDAHANGDLPGLSNDVLRRIGRRVELFPGLVDALRHCRDVVRDESGGHAELRVVVNSCAPAEILRGAFERYPGVVDHIAGQEFRFIPESGGVTMALDGGVRTEYSKPKLLLADISTYGVAPHRCIWIYDGETDLPAAGMNEGLNVPVFELGHPPAERLRDATEAAFWEHFPDRQEGLHLTPPLMVDWRGAMGAIIANACREMASDVVAPRLYLRSSPIAKPEDAGHGFG